MGIANPASETVFVTEQGRVINLNDLEKSLRRPRSFFSVLLSTLITLLTFSALFPLFSVVIMLILHGGQKLSWALFTQLPPAGFETGGGIGNAIIGTVVMVGLACLISLPMGILGAVFLAEVGPNTKLASVVRFCAKVLTGFPSILAGVFAYGAVVLLTGGGSAYAGGFALSILMVPIVMLTAEEAIRMVPSRMREAAIGMGATPTQVICRVLLPTAMPGILTGTILALARAAGETAPLLFTARFSYYWLTNLQNLKEPTASLAVLIYNFSSLPSDEQKELAWAAALVLVFLVLTANLIGQALSPKAAQR
jgi:phosphate transport system permease protein